jgi:hypothetical protein
LIFNLLLPVFQEKSNLDFPDIIAILNLMIYSFFLKRVAQLKWDYLISLI